MKRFTKILCCAGLIFSISAGSALAAIPVKQSAYYNTFIFNVNGNIPSITDAALKPFIANSRVYVPIRTLNDLGIATVEWTPQNGSIPAVLSVTPASGGFDQAKFDELTKANADTLAKNNQLQQKVTQLEKDIETLKSENDKLKEEAKKKEETKKAEETSDDYRDEKIQDKVYALERTFNRDRNFSEILINGKYKPVSYQLSYRRDFDIQVVIKDLDDRNDNDKNDIKVLKENSRSLQYVLEDIQRELSKDFKDKRIYFNIYKNDTSSSNKIGNFDIDGRGRLSGNIY